MGLFDRLRGAKLMGNDILTAIEKGDDATFRKAIVQGADVDYIGSDDLTPLMVAASCSQIVMFRELIKAGAKVDLRNQAGHSVLLLCANAGLAEYVEAVLDAGADVGQRAVNGFTALLLAVGKANEHSAGHFRIIQMLLPRTSITERTQAAFLSTMNGNLTAAKLCIGAGIDPTMTTGDGKVLREVAIEFGRTELIGILDGNSSAEVVPPEPEVNFPGVESRGMQTTETARYFVYSASNRQIALDFLRKMPVREPFTYIVVETPEGAYGRDAITIYDESNNGEVVEYGKREALPQITVSDTHCAKCGYMVFPAAKESLPESVTRHFTVTTIDDARKYGRGTRCTSCHAIWCVFCHNPLDGAMVCPSCGDPLEFYISDGDIVTEYGRSKGYIS